MTATDLHFKVVDQDPTAAQKPSVNVAIPADKITLSGGTATIAYADLKAAYEGTDFGGATKSDFTHLSVHYANNVSGSGDIEKDGQGAGALSPEITTASPPPADTLTVTFDDNADTVTIDGIDTDVTATDLHFKVVDPRILTAQKPSVNVAIPADKITLSGGTATIAYEDLKAAYEGTDFGGATKSDFTHLSVHYANNVSGSGDIEKDGQGAGSAKPRDYHGFTTPADTLTVTFDDNADTVTIGGIDTDVTATDLHFKVVDQDSTAAQKPSVNVAIPADKITLSGGTATIAYEDLKAAYEGTDFGGATKSDFTHLSCALCE